ncbi:MAG: alpha/beta hydrolase [Actinomycetota bacterium]
MITTEELSDRIAGDGEFRLAARFWTGGLRLEIGDRTVGFTAVDGAVAPEVPEPGDGVIILSASESVWADLTKAVPQPFFHDITAALAVGLTRAGDDLIWWQYEPAVQRALELMGPAEVVTGVATADRGTTPRFDSPTGRYVHLALPDVDGDGGPVDHRIYFEETGTGIPLLLQHTAGSHGTQWRHLFENPDITSRFRLIAYDLPFHGKSVPPPTRDWWSVNYRLTGDFLRSVPLALSDALELDRPVFMGCSVGGLLALDLAARHPDRFRAVISLEGALHIGGDPDRLEGFWHPQVSNESKARMMQGLTSPTSPVAYRKETIQTYASGWPPAFLGDLFYYMVDYDLRDAAADIDTKRIGVHILSGEYDTSGTVAHGRAAHEAIPGSTFTEMAGVGHFPMSENPEGFFPFLLAVLDKIESR